MSDLPRMAISIRQPWAWAILHAGKDVENRSWPTKFRGPVAIHASNGMTRAEFDGFVDFGRSLYRAGRWSGPFIPEPKALSRGGIVGLAEVADCVESSASPWFFGPYGFVLCNARPVEFIPCKGALGFFEWSAERRLL